jgi:hypothetical protein
MIILFVYVDDIIIASNSMESVESIQLQLSAKFKMKDLGEPGWILGMQVQRTSESINLSAKQYIRDLLCKYQFENCKPVSTPILPEMTKQILLEKEVCSEMETSTYAKLIGSLNYLACSTRPDIMFAISFLSQKLASPTPGCLLAAKRLLRYLKGTMDLALTFPTQTFSGNRVLLSYSDSDFAACTQTRRSRSGYCILLNGCAISWFSKKQSVIALSTCEAEFYAMTETGKELIHLRRLYWELDNAKPFNDKAALKSDVIFGDNQSCLKVCKNPSAQNFMKHVDVKYRWIREKVDAKVFYGEYVPSEDNVADMLTKALNKGPFEKLRAMIGMK